MSDQGPSFKLHDRHELFSLIFQEKLYAYFWLHLLLSVRPNQQRASWVNLWVHNFAHMNYARRVCMIRQHHVNFALINSERFPCLGFNWQNWGIRGSPSMKGTNLVKLLGVDQIWTFVSAVDNKINLAPQMDIDRREGLHEWGNFNSYHIEHLWEVYQIQHNVAISRAFTFNG